MGDTLGLPDGEELGDPLGDPLGLPGRLPDGLLPEGDALECPRRAPRRRYALGEPDELALEA